MAPGRGLTREKIVGTALRLIDEEGLPSLSMRRLGQELGVEAMALYKHVASKQALLDGVVGLTLAGLYQGPDGSMQRRGDGPRRDVTSGNAHADDVFGLTPEGLDLPSGDSVQNHRPEGERSRESDSIAAIFQSLRRRLHEHPNVLPLLASRPFGSAEGLLWAEETLGGLRAAGLPERVVLSGFHGLLGFTLGYAFLEAGGFVGDIPETEPLLRTTLREMAKRRGPLVPGLADYPADWDHEDDFAVGLGLIVAGAMGAAPGAGGEVRIDG